jgi:hypothetical protein
LLLLKLLLTKVEKYGSSAEYPKGRLRALWVNKKDKLTKTSFPHAFSGNPVKQISKLLNIITLDDT